MRAYAPLSLVLALMLPHIAAAQPLPCGECYDRVPQQQDRSVFDLLPGGDDPRAPGSFVPLSTVPPMVISDGFMIGETIANLRGMNTGRGVRTLVLLNGRLVAAAPFLESCTGSMTGSLTETFGGIEWRIMGCTGSAGEEGPFAELRFEAARVSDSTPRFFLYARDADGDYRLAEVGYYREGLNTDAAFDALSALTPAELEALEQRLREEEGAE